MSLGKFLKKLRHEKNISQEELSAQSSIDLSVIQSIESNTFDDRSLKIIFLLSRFFQNNPSCYIEAEAETFSISNINYSNLQALLDNSHYPKDKKDKLLRKFPTPWGKNATQFIFIAAKYNVFFKVSNQIKMQNLSQAIDSLFSNIFCEQIINLHSSHKTTDLFFLNHIFLINKECVFTFPPNVNYIEINDCDHCIILKKPTTRLGNYSSSEKEPHKEEMKPLFIAYRKKLQQNDYQTQYSSFGGDVSFKTIKDPEALGDALTDTENQ